jgi:ribosomal protein L16 Arg81 hydroxylase
MTFRAMLAPMTTEDFFARHWGRAPLFLTGRSDRFGELPFTPEEMHAHLARRPPTVGVKAQFFDASGQHRVMAINEKQLHACFDAGMTVGVGPVEALLPKMQTWAQNLRATAGFLGEFRIMCYWSPSGTGFGWHYDEVGVFICQIRGSKRWWFSEAPVVECPRDSFVYAPGALEPLRAEGLAVEPPPAEGQTVLLQPGDILYLPAGTWHRTEAEGIESVALTLGLTSGGVDQLVRRCVRGWLDADPTWSRALPFVEPEAICGGRIPDAVQRELAERLASLKSFVDGLSVEDLLRAWA